LQFAAHFAHLRQHDIVSRRAQHQRIDDIIDVLGGAAEVQEVLDSLRFGPISNAFTEEVLYSFDVMIRRCLDILDTFGIVQRKVVDNVIEDVFHHSRQRRQFGHRRLISETLQPAHFD
jgi:hypothetical protein